MLTFKDEVDEEKTQALKASVKSEPSDVNDLLMQQFLRLPPYQQVGGTDILFCKRMILHSNRSLWILVTSLKVLNKGQEPNIGLDCCCCNWLCAEACLMVLLAIQTA